MEVYKPKVHILSNTLNRTNNQEVNNVAKSNSLNTNVIKYIYTKYLWPKSETQCMLICK